jgi:similar to stage IV sporulation protein
MRKNIGNRKRIKPSIYTRYEIVGLNLSRLLSRLVKTGVPLYNVKKIKANKIRLSVNSFDNEKFFANLNELCYNEKNVRKISEGGLFSPVNFLIKNVGFLVGVVIFTLSTFLVDDFILDFSFSGTGAVYEREITQILDEFGVKKYARFSSFNLREIEDRLLEKSDDITFASLEKNGKTLSVYLTKSKVPNTVLSGIAENLKSTVDGVIESIKVYRGTALLSVGDTVKVGEIIVDGFTVRNEVVCKINVIASATILSSVTKTYILDREGLEDIATTFIEEELSNQNLTSVKIAVNEKDGKYEYIATATVKTVIFAG